MARCIFCGGSPTTNAHVFRRGWVDELMPLSRAYRHRRGLETGREWIKDAIDLKVNSVCESCNGGWMDRLDHEVEDMFLTHAAHGFDVKLPSMAQKATLARWCALIATLSDQTNRPPVVPERIPAIIYAGGGPRGHERLAFPH